MVLRRKLTQRWRIISWFFALLISAVFLRVAYAGSLTPSSSPGATMNTVDEIYNPLVGSSYDSSAVTSDSDGNILQITKCIITKSHGGSC